jgi:hypothetical protein
MKYSCSPASRCVSHLLPLLIPLSLSPAAHCPSPPPFFPSSQELWLHDNAIAAIPPNVADLTNLTTLTLSNNQVHLLQFAPHPSLCALSPLQLSSVPEGMRKLTKLNELWLKNNPLPRCAVATVRRQHADAHPFLAACPFAPPTFPCCTCCSSISRQRCPRECSGFEQHVFSMGRCSGRPYAASQKAG